jgi:hypothetical protein|nr:MAG TPA: protein of unknown function (DUF4969) [Herelleviridae sp.]
MMKRLFAALLLTTALLTVAGCDAKPISEDTQNTMEVADTLSANQPTPTDIDYSLERYNLIRRAYWVNGQREKANSLVCEVDKPLGYIVLFTESGSTVGRFIVDGKVSSLNSFLTPDSMYYECAGEYCSGPADENEWVADVDGSFGENDSGIFFFTPDGKYVEWTGTYLYSDIPFEIDDPVVKVGE